MGYMHIHNLYKYPEFFDDIREIYALEKIHGTSSWIYFENDRIKYHGGCVKEDEFQSLFHRDLEKKIKEYCQVKSWVSLKIYGEAYGGKINKMGSIYGCLKFVAFDVYVTEFLDVESAYNVVNHLGLEFVHFEKGINTVEWITQQTNLFSTQALKYNMGNHISEGVVIRPIKEDIWQGKRMIFKSKSEKYSELGSYRPLGVKAKYIKDSDVIKEFLTEERARHVIAHILESRTNKTISSKDNKKFIIDMLKDIKREAIGEIIITPELIKNINKSSAELFQRLFKTF